MLISQFLLFVTDNLDFIKNISVVKSCLGSVNKTLKCSCRIWGIFSSQHSRQVIVSSSSIDAAWPWQRALGGLCRLNTSRLFFFSAPLIKQLRVVPSAAGPGRSHAWPVGGSGGTRTCGAPVHQRAAMRPWLTFVRLNSLSFITDHKSGMNIFTFVLLSTYNIQWHGRKMKTIVHMRNLCASSGCMISTVVPVPLRDWYCILHLQATTKQLFHLL